LESEKDGLLLCFPGLALPESSLALTSILAIEFGKKDVQY
jgi:hypothetical protein